MTLLHQINEALGEQEADERAPINAADLLAREFPEPKWIVPGLIPEGVTLLAGKPKMGKSWLAMAIGIATAGGGIALGRYRVEQGPVLYLALEDNLRRLKSRLSKLLQHQPAPRCLSFQTDWPRVDEGGIRWLEKWLDSEPETRLVIIDTLERIRPKRQRNGNAYSEDYGASQALKQIADKYRVAIILVHHLRKGVSDDPLESISGSFGLTGGVDGALVLRRDRGSADAALYVTGRDVEREQDLALTWDDEAALWSITGSAQDARLSRERQDVIDLIRAEGPQTVRAISQLTRRKYDGTRKMINRMVKDGLLSKNQDSTISLSHMSGMSGCLAQSDAPDT